MSQRVYFCRKCGLRKTGDQCKPCKAKRRQDWRASNRPADREMKMANYRRSRNRALARLGSVCSCCGEKRMSMLHIDHIHNDGYLDGSDRCRKTIRNVLNSHDPSQRFQVLCANCNTSKAVSGGVCEHRNERKVDRFVRFVRRLDDSLQTPCLNFST